MISRPRPALPPVMKIDFFEGEGEVDIFGAKGAGWKCFFC